MVKYAHGTTGPTPVYVPATSEASLADVGRAVVRHWRWVLFPTLLALLASLAFVSIVTPRYTGEARLLLQTSDSYFTRPNGDRAEQAPQIDEQAVASQVQVVMSRDLAREAIKRLDLVGNAEFDPEVGGLSLTQRLAVALGLSKDPTARPPEDRVLEKYYDRLLVYPVGKSRIVAIEFRSEDPDLASRAANTVAELYLGRQEDAKKDQARSASTWLGSNIDGLRTRVAEAEAKVEAFRSKTGLLVGTGTTTLSAQQLSELSAQLAQARTAQSDSQAKAKLIRDLIKDGRAFDIPDVANNELIRRLLEQRVNLRTQLALELRTLLPQHPRIKELNAQLADLETQVRGASDRIVRTLEGDSRIAGSRVESLVTAIETQKKIVSQANEGEVQLRALEREARAQRDQLESYLGRYREASARDADYGTPPDARIVSRSVVPQIPSYPKKGPIVGLSTLAALVLAIGSIMARELLATGPAGARPDRRHEAPGERYPMSRTGGMPAREFNFDLSHLDNLRVPVVQHPAFAVTKSEPAEPDPRYDFGHLVERLSRVEVGARGRRVLVSAVEGREDGFNVAHGLGLTLARTARVVLLCADTEEAASAGARAGLTDLVAGEASFAQVIAQEPGSHLHRIAVGTLVNEALVANGEGVSVVMAALAETYDWVFCALLGTDGDELLKIFAPLVDAVVIASNLEPASPDLVGAYEATRAAGATDVVVAREQATELDVAAA